MSRAWCKVSAHLDSHPKIRRAGNLGRQIFEFALRRNAELDGAGVLPADHLDPEYLADVLMMSADQAAIGLQRAIHAKLLAPCFDDLSGQCPDAIVTVRTCHDVSTPSGTAIVTARNYAIVGWDDEWGKTPLSEAERKRLQRARVKPSANLRQLSGQCPDTKVTESDCPDSHRSDQIRSEKKKISTEQVLSAERGGPGETAPLALEPDSPPPKAKRSNRPPSARSALPELWSPERSDANLEAERVAKARGIDLREQLLAMRDWAASIGERKADWNATWRNWIRRSKPTTMNGTNGHTKTAIQRQLERVAMLEEQERKAGIA